MNAEFTCIIFSKRSIDSKAYNVAHCLRNAYRLLVILFCIIYCKSCCFISEGITTYLKNRTENSMHVKNVQCKLVIIKKRLAEQMNARQNVAIISMMSTELDVFFRSKCQQ